MTAFAAIEPTLPAFVAALDAMQQDYYRQYLPATFASGQVPTYSLDIGKRYIRVVVGRNLDQGSAYCFLDGAGNIYKCDGWNRPATGVRGRLSDPSFSIGRGLGVHGAAYRR